MTATTSGYTSTNTAKTVTSTITVTYTSPCDNTSLTKLIVPTQTSPSANSYDSKAVTFTLATPTLTPSVCKYTVTCLADKRTAPTANKIPCPVPALTANKATFTFGETAYKTNKYSPGVHTFVYQVKVNDSTQAALKKEFSFTVTLTDPCNPPTMINAGLVTQTFTVG